MAFDVRKADARYTDIKRTIRWHTDAPDPIDEPQYIGDKLDLQILAEVDGRLISGHWEMSETEWQTVIFVPDFICKDVISTDEIDFWCYVRSIT